MDDIRILQNKLLEMLIDFDSFCKENDIKYSLDGGNILGAVRHKGFIPWDDDVDVQMTRENYDKLMRLFKNNDKYFMQQDTIDYPLKFAKLRANNTTFIEDIPYKKKYRNIHQGIYIDIFPVDKVSKNKISAKLQVLFSNILMAQSLFDRGYPKSHSSIKKNIIMIISILLKPFSTCMYKYVKKFNKQSDYDFYCSYFGTTYKIYQHKSCYDSEFVELDYENLKFPVINNYVKYLTDLYGDYMQIPSKEQIEYKIHAKYFDVNKSYLDFIK